ncbi:MAG: multifunctional CCA addition/repair protein [Alteromonadaceae bacterium]|nr:multifunctional CCA addition/repair protein [Alteromonadaceae bacterium]
MKAYLVGGFVRDTEMKKILGTNITPKDRDWVVVGSTADEMIKKGFTRVGAFPVFLHPKNKEEWALARTEKKNGKGYKGFDVDFTSSVTLEEDLSRRDLTINAIAKDPDTGEIVDPYNGRDDIQRKVLRHVSPAFVEDPLRVLRVARFSARFYDFTIAKETMEEMQRIVDAGELKYLTAERVWKEMHSSLEEDHPKIFFNVLRECGALKEIWPELDALWGVPNPALWHPEICSGIHTMMVLQQAVILSPKATIRFAALCHDLGKGITPEHELPSHKGHEKTGLPLVEKVCQQFKVPNEYKQLALKVCQFHLHCHKAFELKSSTILKLFNQLDVWRKPQEFEDFLMTCEADFKGRKCFENKIYPQADFLRVTLHETLKINTQVFIEQGKKGKAIKEAIDAERIHIIKNIKTEYFNT